MKVRLVFIGIFFLSGMMKLSAQSPMENMKKYAGDWDAIIMMWMSGSDQPMKDEVNVHSEMMMNNLFLTSHYTGTLMETPYEGMETLGYDLQKKIFVNTFVDNMNSGIQYTEGTAAADGKSIELRGKIFDGNSNQEVPLREVLTFTDATHQKIEFYMTANGAETKTMEIDLVKK